MKKDNTTSPEGTEVEFVNATKIETVAHEFGREDLNEVKDKLNQVIEIVNNLD